MAADERPPFPLMHRDYHLLIELVIPPLKGHISEFTMRFILRLQDGSRKVVLQFGAVERIVSAQAAQLHEDPHQSALPTDQSLAHGGPDLVTHRQGRDTTEFRDLGGGRALS